MATLFDIDIEEPAATPADRRARLMQEIDRRAEERARLEQEWAPIRQAGQDLLALNEGTLSRFHGEMETLFRAMEGEPKIYKKKPNISLRLIAEGEPPAKMIVLPSFTWRKTLDCSSIRCEILTEREVETRKGPAKQWAAILAVKIDRQRADFATRRRTVVDDLARLVATIEGWLADRKGVLARGHDQCAICGRSLTDELSRSRGIGPECIQKLPGILGVITDASIVVPENAV